MPVRHPNAEPTTRNKRLIGTAVLVTATLVVVGLQYKRGGGRREQALDVAFAELARADLISGKPRKDHVIKAQAAFVKAAAVVSLEPQALIGVAMTDVALTQWGQPVYLPCAPTQCSQEQVVVQCRSLIERGKPSDALQFAQVPEIARHRPALTPLERFAERWLAARKAIPGM